MVELHIHSGGYHPFDQPPKKDESVGEALSLENCMTKRLTTEEFVSKAKLVPQHQYKNYDYSKVVYVVANIKVEIICPKHGPFWQTPNNHLRGKGCPACSGHVKLTNEIIDNKILRREITRLGEVNGNHNKILWKCLRVNCEHEWRSTVGSILQGTGCPACVRKSVWDNQKIDAFLKDRPIQRVGEAGSVRYKIMWRCLISGCGQEWMTYIHHVIRGTGCPTCSKSGFDPSKPSIIYVYTIDDKYCGYGITNDFKQRNTSHKRNFRKSGVSAKLITIFKCSGVEAQRIETLLKKTFDVVNTGIGGFKTEATYLHNLTNVLECINSNLKDNL